MFSRSLEGTPKKTLKKSSFLARFSMTFGQTFGVVTIFPEHKRHRLEITNCESNC